MYKLLLLSILSVTSVYRAEAGEQKCSGVNEEYVCGSKCPKTCSTLDTVAECLSGCEEGCFCKEGYVRNEETRKCVKPNQCKLKCPGANEEYTCGYKCQKTCTNLDIAKKCVNGCDDGCFCKKGFVRNEETGECIKPTECTTCGHNETYKRRGFNCQTCSNHQIVECPLLEEYRCYCRPGQVRRDDTGACINPQDCPEALKFRRNSPDVNGVF